MGSFDIVASGHAERRPSEILQREKTFREVQRWWGYNEEKKFRKCADVRQLLLDYFGRSPATGGSDKSHKSRTAFALISGETPRHGEFPPNLSNIIADFFDGRQLVADYAAAKKAAADEVAA